MKTSIIRHPKHHPLIIVRKWQIEACGGDVCAAALLSFFEYWHNIKLEQAKKAKESNDVAETHGDSRTQDESLLQFHNEGELAAGIMIYGETRIGESIKLLAKQGFITIHKNPNARYKFDRTRYFLFQADAVQTWIDSNYGPGGGNLRDASVISDARLVKTDDSTVISDAPSSKNVLASLKNDAPQGENDASYTEIPSEVTSEVSSNINSVTRETKAAIAVADDFKKSDFAPLALTPAQLSVDEQLSAFVAARGISLNDEDAALLLENWPAARLADCDLIGALTTDFLRYGLDEPVDGSLAAKMFRTDAARLRWFLCVWGGFKESTDAYQEQTGKKWSKTRCFLNKWQKEQPPAAWLEAEIRAVRDKIQSERFKAEQIAVEAFWKTLSPAQMRAMDNDALADLKEKQPGEHFDLRSPELRARRWQMLRQEETRQWLLEMAPAPARSETVDETVEGEIVEDDYDDLGDIAPPTQLRFEAIIGAILQDVNAGKLQVLRLDDARPPLLGDAEGEEDWQEIKRQVTLRLAA
jgi:hypothetical protein